MGAAKFCIADFPSIVLRAFVRRARKPLSASLLDVDLTHSFLLPNDLDLIA
jgi:hypothetical protein